MSFLKKIPLIGWIAQKDWRTHKEALNIFLISWFITSLPIWLKLLKNINNKTEDLFPATITDVIVYAISFLAPFVFCYKREKNSGVFRNSKEACWGLCVLIFSVSLLSFYFTLPQSDLRIISKIIIGLLYIVALVLWYFSILTSIDEDTIEENFKEADCSIKKEEQNFIESFNATVNKEK